MSGVKLKRAPVFPRQVIGGAGIDVEKKNGNFTISLDYAEFGLHSPYVPQPSHRVVIFAQGTNGYFTVPTSVFGSDPHLSNVVFLMGFEGPNNSIGAPGMTDESPSAHGTGTNAFDAIITTSFHKAGSSCLQMINGATGEDAITWPGSNDWNFGSGAFTIEGFLNVGAGAVSGSGRQDIFVGPVDNWYVYWSGNLLSFTATNGTTPFTISDTTNTLTGNQWYYFCIDFDGLKYRLYDNMNGAGGLPLANAAMVASNSSPITIASNSGVTVQFGTTAVTVGHHSFFGYIDEFRITKGVARYASDSGFAVPTVPFPRH
jgi:hypothetical protein